MGCWLLKVRIVSLRSLTRGVRGWRVRLVMAAWGDHERVQSTHLI